MPAPLARGIIFSISLLIAAGIAVYENPQVREWIDENRRKLAHSLHTLGDDIHPRPSYSRSRSSEDASVREDTSPEAAERRRLAREQIQERARIIEEKRRGVVPDSGVERRRGSSFDDLVDGEGRLHEKEPAASTSATEPIKEEEGLRNRHAAAAGVAAAGLATGAIIANPFGDEMAMEFSEKVEEPQQSRESTATLQEEPAPLAIDTEIASAHPSEMLVDLTPTTSAAPSSFPLTDANTPTSESDIQMHDEGSQVSSTANFQSVHEWAEASSTSLYSAPESIASEQEESVHSNSTSSAAPLIDADERLSHADVMSDVSESIHTPDSWTEVGSMISDEEM